MFCPVDQQPRDGRGRHALMVLLIWAAGVHALAAAPDYRFAMYSFPDAPHHVYGVQYRAGDVNCAMPLGGLGTGTVYFDSRGQFTGQALTNTYRPVGGVMADCGFSVSVTDVRRTVTKPLSELAQTYLGHFPMVDIGCGDQLAPVSLQLRATSPFILGDAKDSGTPASLFRFRCTNNGTAAQKVTIHFRWTPPVQEADTGRSSSGNVDGFLTWKLGELAPGAHTSIQATFAAGKSMNAVLKQLKDPAGDIVVDDDGAFNWEDRKKQCLTTAAGPCLSQHGFFVQYNDGQVRRAGTLVTGNQRLQNLQRDGRDGDTIRLRSTEGDLRIEVRPGNGTVTYTLTNTTQRTLSDVRLSVYANLEAGHTEMDDRGRLDANLNGLVITDPSGAACALAGDHIPSGGWSGRWGGTIPRLIKGDDLPRAKWEDSSTPFDQWQPREWTSQDVRGVTREDARDHSGCSIAALTRDGVDVSLTPAADAPNAMDVAAFTTLAPHASRDLCFILAWYYPDARDSDDKFVGHQYANWFGDSAQVAKTVSGHWDKLLQRVGAWQETIYDNEQLPTWLRDQLVNSLYSLARNTCWLKDGRFSHSESFVGCPITETIVCRFYGSIPLALFFPDLEKSTMRQFIRHQRVDGAIPFCFGSRERWDSPYYETQKILDSSEFALMAWRDFHWWKDAAWGREAYPAAKRALQYAATLDTDGDGLINDDLSKQYYDCWQFHGASAYTSGIWLAALKSGAEFAKVMHDEAFRKDCEARLEKAQAAFEKELWTGNYYRLWNDPVHERRSDTCLAAQLTGQWYAYLCGLGEVLPHDRIVTALQHIAATNGKGDVQALINGVTPDGARDQNGTNSQSSSATLGETWCFAATSLYAGYPDLDMPFAQRLAADIALRQRRLWATTWNLDPDSGAMLWGNEYYSNMCVWGLYEALTGEHG